MSQISAIQKQTSVAPITSQPKSELPKQLGPQAFCNQIQVFQSNSDQQGWSADYLADQIYKMVQENSKTAAQLGFPTELPELRKIALQQGFKNNVLWNGSIIQKHYPHLEQEQLSQIHGLVLHRTDGPTAQSAMDGYGTFQPFGAHYLIDTNGTIYQTASINRVTWHIGTIKPRCEADSSCMPDVVKQIENQQWDALHSKEASKIYPARYPTNSDALGIEVVGLYNKKTKTYEAPESAQIESLNRLVDSLKERFQLSKDDIYLHGVISGHKKPSEGHFMGY